MISKLEATQLAEILRPSLEELSRHFFRSSPGILGLCFDLAPDTDPLFFAESHRWQDTRKVSEVPYFLPRHEALSEAVLTDLGVSLLTVAESDEEASVRTPVEKIFGKRKYLRVMSLSIGQNTEDDAALAHSTKAVAYLVTTLTARGALLRFAALQDLSFLLVHVVRYSLFLLRASDSRLLQASNRLNSLLAEGLPDLEDRGQDVLKYAQWGESPPPGHYGSRVYSNMPEPRVVQSDDLAPPLSEEEQKMLRSLRSHREILVIRRLEGSFQQTPVLMAELQKHEENSRPFMAVIKKVREKQAKQELEGYQTIDCYHRDVKDVLPPRPSHVLQDDEEDWHVVWTPHVSGSTLFEVALHNAQTIETAETTLWFKEIFGRLCNFLDAIGRESEQAISAYELLLESHLGDGPEASRRQGKTLEALRAFVPAAPDEASFRPPNGSTDLINPLWLFEHHGSMDGPWKVAEPSKSVVYFHGDFHVGNVLVSQPDNISDLDIYVLDFDYVGEGARWEDRACLEASFLLAVGSGLHEDFGSLYDTMVPCIENLAGIRDSDASLARRLLEIVGVLRPQDEREIVHYYAALVKALLRLSASHYRKGTALDGHSPIGLICSHYIGALFTQLIQSDD